MAKTRVYLDNCCLNRPFDDPLTPLIPLEAEAKIYIQRQIRAGEIELAWSFILDHECAANPYRERKKAIESWKHRAVADIGPDEDVYHRTISITACGIPHTDALHIACAIKARCRYFLTTDKQVLKKKVEGISLLNPLEYVQKVEGGK